MKKTYTMTKERLVVAAVGQNNFVIGSDGQIPWDLAKDRKICKEITLSAGSVIMGRKTYESLPQENPLPGRHKIVLTNDQLWGPPGPERDDLRVVHCPWEALHEAEKAPGEKIAIFGGGEIYTWYMQNVVIHDLYLSYVIGQFTGNIYFPYPKMIDEKYALVGKEEYFEANEKNSHNFFHRHYRIVR